MTSPNAGFRMGPFRLMDLVGNEVNLAVSPSIYEPLGEPEGLRPSALQQQKWTRVSWIRSPEKAITINYMMADW